MENIAGFRIMLHPSPVSNHQKEGIFVIVIVCLHFSLKYGFLVHGTQVF